MPIEIFLADDHAASRIAMHLTRVAQQRTGIEFSWMEHCLPVQNPRGLKQAVHDIRYSLNGATDLYKEHCSSRIEKAPPGRFRDQTRLASHRSSRDREHLRKKEAMERRQ